MSTVKDNTTELREILNAVNNLPPAGGTLVTVDTELSSTSENPVQNKVIYEALEDKVEKEEGKGLSTNDLTDDLKEKYDEAYEKANEAETDPTVPSWAKQPNKPTYTASEVGAVPTTRKVNGQALSADVNLDIPDSLAELGEDAAHRTVSDTEKSTWNNKSDFSGSYNDLTDKPSIPSVEGLASTDYVDRKVASIVDSSPEALNTLSELAASLGNDPNFATTVSENIGKKVDKATTVNGHPLSGNVTVSKSDVELGNVPNVATNDQTPTFTEASELENINTGEKVSVLFGKIKKAITDLVAHIASKSNPHGVTKAQIDLGNVENKSSETIRGEITKENVTSALAFTPVDEERVNTLIGQAIDNLPRYNGEVEDI